MRLRSRLVDVWLVFRFVFEGHRGFMGEEEKKQSVGMDYNKYIPHYDVESHYFIECAEIMADVLLIWRLYVIWHKNKKIIILPAVLLASDFAMGTTIWLMAIITGINRRASQFSQAFFVLSIVNSTCALLLNVYSTTLVISRLWWDSRRASTPQTRGLYKTVIVSLVESGAMFTVTLILYSLFILLEIDGLTAFSQYVFTMVIAIAPMLIVIHLHENFPAPRAHSAVDGEVVLQSSSNSGSGFRRHTKEKTYSGAKMVISPVESFRMKPFRSSRPQDDSQIRSSMSAREARAWQEIPVTVEALSTTVTEMRLRLEEDQDMEKGDFGREEDEGLSPPPTPKFLEDLDYFPRDERRDAQMAGARREAPSYFHQ
ncbi:hypothetical protein FRB97_005815 [Tulasnella sp. 331]|nr:hypothetical protein FRB97_005815 [Tulasnella sp. 331]